MTSTTAVRPEGPSVFTDVYEYLDYIELAKYRAANNIDPHVEHPEPNPPASEDTIASPKPTCMGFIPRITKKLITNNKSFKQKSPSGDEII